MVQFNYIMLAVVIEYPCVVQVDYIIVEVVVWVGINTRLVSPPPTHTHTQSDNVITGRL